MDVNDEDNWSCSAAFELTEVEDVVIDEEADWQSGMTVVSPDEGDLAYAGQEYTVLVREKKAKRKSEVSQVDVNVVSPSTTPVHVLTVDQIYLGDGVKTNHLI